MLSGVGSRGAHYISVSFGLDVLCLSNNSDMRARGCVWDMEIHRRRNKSDAGTQNRKCI